MIKVSFDLIDKVLKVQKYLFLMQRIRKIIAEKVHPRSRKPQKTDASEGALIKSNAIERMYIVANNSKGINASI